MPQNHNKHQPIGSLFYYRIGSGCGGGDQSTVITIVMIMDSETLNLDNMFRISLPTATWDWLKSSMIGQVVKQFFSLGSTMSIPCMVQCQHLATGQPMTPTHNVLVSNLWVAGFHELKPIPPALTDYFGHQLDRMEIRAAKRTGAENLRIRRWDVGHLFGLWWLMMTLEKKQPSVCLWTQHWLEDVGMKWLLNKVYIFMIVFLLD